MDNTFKAPTRCDPKGVKLLLFLWLIFSLGVESFIPMEEFKTGKVAEGTKPCLLFAGETFADTTNQGRLGTPLQVSL